MINETKRRTFLILGHILFGLGMLAASWFYARSSKRFYEMIHKNRFTGPPLLRWEEHRSISRRAKILAVVSIVVGISLSCYLAPLFPVQVMLVVIGVTVSTFIITRPEGSEAGSSL